ncbi:hypothetical protein [Haloarcula litorea]|uniref:hypothetical protein n=1 Tax=Haloarcula litorea TaxID=3032579 RepID=UPI0023E8253A|nr:hypothetical protein [Halomicroarcula sp. GDY20]
MSLTDRRLAVALTAVAGIFHLLAPDLLLRTARWGYRRVLAVEFHPKRGASRRVRAVGVGFLLLAAALRRYTADST